MNMEFQRSNPSPLWPQEQLIQVGESGVMDKLRFSFHLLFFID